MLTSSDLDYMRGALGELMPDTCNILAATTTTDGQGGVTQTWGTALASVACRLDPSRKEMTEKVTAAALKPYTAWYLTLPHDTAITTNSRVEHGGYTYNVIGVDIDKSWTGTVRATVMRV